MAPCGLFPGCDQGCGLRRCAPGWPFFGKALYWKLHDCEWSGRVTGRLVWAAAGTAATEVMTTRPRAYRCTRTAVACRRHGTPPSFRRHAAGGGGPVGVSQGHRRRHRRRRRLPRRGPGGRSDWRPPSSRGVRGAIKADHGRRAQKNSLACHLVGSSPAARAHSRMGGTPGVAGTAGRPHPPASCVQSLLPILKAVSAAVPLPTPPPSHWQSLPH